jgi:hypothetical protein
MCCSTARVQCRLCTGSALQAIRCISQLLRTTKTATCQTSKQAGNSAALQEGSVIGTLQGH